jgi:hypothetical protein
VQDAAVLHVEVDVVLGGMLQQQLACGDGQLHRLDRVVLRVG